MTSSVSSTKNPTLPSITPSLSVPNLPATVSFYKEKLGFQISMAYPSENDPIWVSLSHQGSANLMLSTLKDMPQSFKWSSDTMLGNGVMLYLKVNNVDEFFRDVKEKNVEIVKEPENKFYGAREFVIRDNNGFILTFGGDVAGAEDDSSGLKN